MAKVPPPTNIPDALFTRAMSGFNLSVATGLAMESVFEPTEEVIDPNREVPDKLNINKDYLFMINIETLYRNFMGSISKDVQLTTQPEHIAYLLLEEIRVIESLCAEEGAGKLTPYFYYTDYDKVTSYFNKIVKKRQAKSPLQIENKKKMDKALEYLCILREDIHQHKSKFDYPRDENCILFSHHPYDLLFYPNFKEMVLLESHTGKIKKRVQWNTKYYPYPNQDMSIFPFNRTLLLVFGDRSQYSPTDLKLRKYVVDAAISGKWTPLTTRVKMLDDFNRYIPEPYIVALLSSL